MTDVPYAAYPKFGPEVLGQREYDKQMKAWEAYQASLRQQQPPGEETEDRHKGDDLEEHDGHYDDDEGGSPPGGESGDDGQDGQEDKLGTYTYTRKYTKPGQKRQRRFREQGILASSKGEAKKMGREAMAEALGERGVDYDVVPGTEKVAKPRGKPFSEGDDNRRNEDGKNQHGEGNGSGGGSGGNGGSGEGSEGGESGGGGDDDTPRPPTCPECGKQRGTTEGCCKQDDPGDVPPPAEDDAPKQNLQLLRTDGQAPYMNGEAEARVQQAAHPEVIRVLTKSLAEVDTWTRAVVKHDVNALATELYEALAMSHKALNAKLAKLPKGSENGKGTGQSLKGLDKDAVKALVEASLKDSKLDLDSLATKVAEKISAPRRIVVETDGETHEITGTPHKQFEPALKAVNRGLWPFLVGPAGSGKGFLAQHLAEALGRRYGFVSCSEGMSEGMLLGRGVPLADRFLYLQSSFVDFYENGGVFLLDEIDAANPNVLLIINEALSSPHLAIPNRTEKPYAKRSPDFVAIVAANTWGTGPNMEYVGRNRLDAAFLNRFVGSQFEIDYDPAVETEIARTYLGAKQAETVLRRFWGIRKKLEELQIRRIWSTRGLQKMCVAIADGDEMATVLDAHTSGWTKDERSKAGVA